MGILAGKHITLAVTGGIAAYKACELVRLLAKAGSTVTCAMTPAATRFVTPLTFETLTQRPVYVDPFAGGMPHLALTRGACDLLVIAPATANTLAKIAHGIADNLVTSLALGRACPLAVAPAMNDRMWADAATQANIATLQSRGVHVIGPAQGDLACGVTGSGRMSEPAEIVAHLERILTEPILAGRHVLVTAGPTYEALDPVRGITNKSSGKQGYAIAKAAFEAGADVVLVSGPTALACPTGVRRIVVESAVEMMQAVEKHAATSDIFISVAAVADWRAVKPAASKVKKEPGGLPPHFELTPNPDILAETAAAHPGLYCAGFAAETEDVEAAARSKLVRKHARMIVGNLACDTFGRDDNAAVIVTADRTLQVARTAKDELARTILALIAQDLGSRRI